MKKLTALLLAIVLVLSLCTAAVAADEESVTIVLVPEDETLLTAEDLALFFVDRDAVDKETETSVSWYKETTKDGKTERELVEEMPLIIKITAVGPRIFVDVSDGYKPSQELIDLVKAYAPEKDPNSEHEYCWHRIFNQDCRWLGLRYGTCKDCFGIEFDLCRGNHSYKDDICTVCGKEDPDAMPKPTAKPAATPKPTTAPTTVPSPTAAPTTEPPHEHDYSNVWSHNDEEHWRNCTKLGCDEKSAVGKHDWDNHYTQRDGETELNGICKVCGRDEYLGAIS